MITLIICIFTISNIIIIFYTLRGLKNYKYTYKWPSPSKFQIFIDHINFLLFPYIIEFLSFSYYIYFFPKKFIIKLNDSKDKYYLIFIIIINTILIIIYNIDNYIGIFCSNKTFTITIFDADLNEKETKIENSKPISYRCSSLGYYVIIVVQNFILFITLENYINNQYNKLIYKAIISILLLISILLFFLDKINTFNYLNFINASINILFLLCLYSIIIDLILFFLGYKINNILNEFIYLLIKLFLGFVTYMLLILKSYKFLESKISDILFDAKNEKKEEYLENSFYLLHEIMLVIKEKNLIDNAHALVKFLNKHINNCSKKNCSCLILKAYTDNGNINIINDGEYLQKYISQYLSILNYLFESAFVEKNFYNNYDLTIILAEHFCHLKNNPTMAFSIISTLILKQRDKLSKFQMVVLYELNQKYVYYISAKIKKDIENEIMQNKNELLTDKKREDIFKNYYHNLILSNKIKKIMINYIDNIIKILKYKNIFEESLSFQFDENNEIISVKINFFEQNTKIENLNNKSNNKKHKEKIINYDTNLYIIIYLLKLEQIYFKEIIHFADKIQISKDLPIFLIFKYFLFFDIFLGRKIPDQIAQKLYKLLMNSSDLYNSNISSKEYSILKRRYKEQNNRIDSKVYVLVEFKKELTTKYFTEDGALKLGFNQKDIINKKIDILMPNEFCKSHQNAIKHIIIGNQIRYSISKQSYYFNKESNILYSANFEGSLIYNISKSLIMMLESIFNFENQYRFMLNNKFELMANSRNFEDEYYLNQKILRDYNIHFLDIIKIKTEKIRQKFENEFKKISQIKVIRQAKTQEYFIPEFYVPKGDKIFGKIDINNFNHSRINILSKIINSRNKEEENTIENWNNENDYKDEEEQINLIPKKNISNIINDLFINPREVIFNNTYYTVLNKGKFIENLEKELIKIPDNDLMMENNKKYHNLIKSSKHLIYNLSKKNDLLNHYMKVSLKLSFYYDKPFYFLTIEDEKKLYLDICKTIHFENNNMKKISSSNNNQNILPYNKKDKKSRNKNLINKIPTKINNNNNSTKNHLINKKNLDLDYNNLINKKEIKKTKILKAINENKKIINKAEFINIIKLILSIIIFCIIIIYIIIIIFQNSLIKKMQLIFLAYYFNSYTKNLLLGIYSILLYGYYDYYIYNNISPINYLTNYYILNTLTDYIKESYHNYTIYFYSFNLAIGNDFKLMYQKVNFTKLRGYWEENKYESEYSTEFDYFMYNIFSFNPYEFATKENNIDFKNFLFFKKRTETHEKVNCRYVKLLYYFCANHEFAYKDIYKEIESSIYNSFQFFFAKQNIISISLEIIGLLLYIIFFIIVMLYLYYSNIIIIKNIIFLFLDFSLTHYDKNKINNRNKINLKLIEFENIINDFDLDLFERYSKNIDNLNKQNNINFGNIIDSNSSSNFIDNLQNGKITESHCNLKKNENLKQLSLRKKNNNNDSIEMNNLSKGNLLFESNNKNKKINISSSHNYLMESNSQFFKEKLNSNSIRANDSFLSSKNNDNINSKNITKQNFDNKNLEKFENEEINNYQDILLNKSNKSIILMIRIYFIIVSIFFIISKNIL